MNGQQWTQEYAESDDLDETFDDLGEGDSAEAFGTIGSIMTAPVTAPAAGLAALSRLRGKRKLPPPPRGRGYFPAPASPPQVPASQRQVAVATSRIGEDVRKLTAAVDTVQQRLDSYAGTLDALRRTSASGQAAELFRYSLTNAASSVVPALRQQDWGLAATNAIPFAQSLWSNRIGAASSFTSPANTLIFPLVALGLGFFGDKVRRPATPIISLALSTGTGTSRQDSVSISTVPGAGIYYETSGAVPPDPTQSSKLHTTGLIGPLSKGDTLKVRAISDWFGLESGVATYGPV
jgi:hypothetical protein